jgi:hypothetical protein
MDEQADAAPVFLLGSGDSKGMRRFRRGEQPCLDNKGQAAPAQAWHSVRSRTPTRPSSAEHNAADETTALRLPSFACACFRRGLVPMLPIVSHRPHYYARTSRRKQRR